MLKRLLAALLMCLFLSVGSTAQAYDLPLLKPDKKITRSEKKTMLKSDWKDAQRFEQEMKARLSNDENLAPNDPARLPEDKNFVFIGFYNGAPYFLDRYSIKIKKISEIARVWKQNIFPITQNFSPQNATSTHQKFCLKGGRFFNSTRANDDLMDLENATDRIFLLECFKVGYYFAFGEEVVGTGI